MKKRYIILVVVLVLVAMGAGYMVNGKVQARQAEDYFMTQLKAQPQELQDAYAKGGLEAYNKQVDFYLAKQAFAAQYGKDVTVDQMIIPERVYASAWTSKDGIKHVSWCIGGLWVEVWNSGKPTQQAQPVQPNNP